jgi:predicted AlkP superfamily phosphohydrolase/phosphomutase
VVGGSIHFAPLVLAVLSLDSVSAPIVDALRAEGRLPNLAELQRRGRSLELAEELEGAAYTTLYTGRRLAEHGIYYPLQWSAEAQATLPGDDQRAAEMERHSLFRRLARDGRRVLVLDPSECAPHDVDGGVVLSGIQVRARILLREWSRPAGVRRELGLGRAPRADDVFGRPTSRRLLRLRRRLLDAPGRLAAAAEHLLRSREFDLAWITFTACHQAGHVLFDPSLASGELGPDEARELRGALADTYVRADEALGRILAVLPPGADVMILAPKGMGVNCSRVDMLGGMLDLVLGQGRRGVRSTQASPLWLLRSAIPLSCRASVANLLPDPLVTALMGRLEMLGRDWARTRAFAPASDPHGFVRFNLQGRERRGSVAPQQAAALAAEIADGLRSFEDVGGAADGAPSVSRVATAGEVLGAEAAPTSMPDLLVYWSSAPSARLRGVRSARFGEVARRDVGTGRSGNHCPGTWLTLLPGSSRLAPEIREPGRLEDVAATVCAALGTPHSDLPGQALLLPSDGQSRGA